MVLYQNEHREKIFLVAISNSPPTHFVEALVPSVELVDKHLLPLFPVSWILIEYFFYDSDGHVTYAMARLIKVLSSCFVF